MPTILPFDAFDLRPDEVRRRFDWAVRQGHPRWLWPETPVEAWQMALGQIERVTRQVLSAENAGERLRGPPEALGVAAYTSGMGPQLGAWLRQGLIEAPADIGAILELHLRHNARRMEAMARRAQALVEALADAGVAAMVFKGMDTAWSIFPEPAVRPLSDIDLLVDPAREPAASAVLSRMGFVPGRIGRFPPARNWRMANSPSEPRTLALVHADDPWSVDLQTSLDRRYSYGAPVIELDRLRSATTLEPWRLSAKAVTLADEARLVHLACHASCGLQSLSLLRLVELVFGIRARPVDWADYIALAKRARALPMTYPALRLAEHLAPGTVPREVLDACEREVPQPVRRVIAELTPGTAQRVLRCSLEERFMWSLSPLHKLTQALRELHPPGLTFGDLPGIYRARAWRLIRGTLTR